jgi:multiple sugar transport system substrate-binding protein
MAEKLSRRSFLKLTGLVSGTAALALAGCAPPAAPAPAAPAAEEKPAEAAAEAPAEAPAAATGFAGVTVKMHAISGGNYEKLYETIPAWETATGAKVEIVFKGNGFETDKRLVQDFAAGTVEYDVCWDHTSFFSQYVKADGLEPLDAYFTAEELADFIPRLVDAGRKDGKLWLIPRHYDISLMQYRTDLEGLAAPATWDEFKETAIKFTDPAKGVYGTQFAGKEEALTGRFYEVFTAEGGALFDDKWEPTFNSAAGVKAATMFADLYKAKAMPPGMTNFVWDDVAKNFANGTIALYTEWPGWYGYFQDPSSSQVAGKFDYARQPMGDGKIHGGWAGAHGFSVTKASQHKDAAVSLIKHLTSVDSLTLESTTGLLVARQSVFDKVIEKAATSGVALDKKRLDLVLLAAQEDLKTPPLIAEWLPMSNIFYPIMQKIILGDVAAQAGLDDAAAQVRKMMDDAGYY